MNIRRPATMRSARLKVLPVVAVMTASVFLCCCAKKQQPEQNSTPVKQEQSPVSAGPPMADSVRFQYAVYMLPVHTHDPATALHEALTKKYPDLKLVDETPKEPREMLVHAHMQKNVKQEYPPPTVELLQYDGHGLSRRQAERLQKSREAFILDFAHPRQNVWEALQTANGLVEDIARKTGGLVWDEETREVFSPDAWHEKRLASSSWTAGAPDISSQTVIHAYKPGEYVRAITLGMAKTGLPDVVVEGFPWSASDQMGDVINIFCQSMAEGATFRNPGKFKMDLRAIKNAELRDSRLKFLKPNATGMACLSLHQGKWEEGDPKNRLIELTFDRYAGPDVHAKQEKMLSSFFGWEESITHVQYTEEIQAESRKERAKLPELHNAFSAGLQPGEFIEVKAPFETPNGGKEWMWVEVTSWKANHIEGLLENDPFNVPNLHSGQTVKVQEEDVFDYIRQYPDEHREGNTTGAILRKMEEERNGKGNATTVDVQSPSQPAAPVCDSD